MALTGGMFLSGHNTPRLGIDLAGGTSITLSAVAEEGNEDAINSTNLNTAVNIIERRVNGLGVSEAEVQTQGSQNIIVNIPKGSDEEQAREQVGTTAELGFRPVLSSASALPATEEPTDEPTDGSTEEPTDEPSDEASEEPTDEATDGSTDSGDGETENQSLPAPGAANSATTAGYASYRTEETEAPDSGEEPTDEPSGDASEEPADDATEEPTDEATEQTPEEQAAAEDAADLQARLDALDCTTEEGRLAASQAAAQAKDDEPTVACDSDGVYKYVLGPVAVPGTDVSSADAVFDSQQGRGWIVQMEFNGSGADKFADITAELATQVEPQNRFAIVLDGEIVSAPTVSERLGGGSAEISGGFNQESAEDLANILKYGALPLSFEEASVSTVSPTLGGEQLRAGLIAGAIGLALVVIYMVLYYRGLSLIAIASLLVSSVLTYTIMSLLGPAIGFALNLPAVCGAIVAIGITADSFIVYFERIRDEIREGRTLRPAVERAWPRARRTILVSDFVSFLAAAVLFVVTVGKVQGFAFTLGLTTALDVVVVFLFTKPLMTLLARRKFFAGGHPWSGLDPKRLGARPLLRGRRPAPVPSDPKEA
ncbi:protein translocase subunit SecD [Streptomyces litchfieldiae]|uniref:Protein translocase subunit SecD n=1 Tax=Streptomyces litchfieldiae TaxID=3075543 RepID=A0ABU2MYE0_9ACTN|nr:protein translocase subunit SecD [Streptomyces sp. DSM 44938]MDT0345564.1 protein translocase subunit SecD [Streptomyces sp. DSM 44938]